MKRNWWMVLIVIAVVGLGYGGFRWAQARSGATGAETTAAAAAMETAVVTRGTLRAYVDGSGNVQAARSVNLAFGTAGTVAEVMVDVGDEVTAGQLLARLETADLEDAVTQAELSLAEAELNLARTLRGPSEEDLAAARASLDSARAAYRELNPTEEEIAQAELSLRQAEIALENAQAAYDRAGGGWRVEVEYSDVATALWQAQANYQAELASYNALLAGGTDAERQAAWAQVQQAEANLELLEAGPDEHTIRLAELAVEQAEIELARARDALEQATLVAPWAGTVTAVEAEVGALAGGPAVVVETSDRLEVPIYLDENDIVQVRLGQPAAVTLDAYRDLEVAGEVVRVAPTADVLSGVVLYPVTVALEPLEVPVRLGMGADVEILTADVEGALIIPRHAVQYVGGQAIVLRQLRDGETPDSVSRPLPGMGDAVEGQGDGSASLPQLPEGTNSAQLPGNGFVPVRVELGPQTATEVVVLSGLEEGDVVSVANLSALGGNAGLGTFGGMRGGGFGAFQP